MCCEDAARLPRSVEVLSLQLIVSSGHGLNSPDRQRSQLFQQLRDPSLPVGIISDAIAFVLPSLTVRFGKDDERLVAGHGRRFLHLVVPDLHQLVAWEIVADVGGIEVAPAGGSGA